MITMSDMAADKIKEILLAEGLPNHAFRVAASAGGCCGPSYEVMLDDKAGDGDTIVEKNGARLFVDAATAMAIDGVELGYIKEERGEGFVLNNLNADQTGGGCGCGGSCGDSAPATGSGGGCGSGACSCG